MRIYYNFFDENEIFKSIVDAESSIKNIPNKFCVLDEKAYYGKCAKCGKIVKYSSKHRYRIWSGNEYFCSKCSRIRNINKALEANKLFWDKASKIYNTEKAKEYRENFINSGMKYRIGMPDSKLIGGEGKHYKYIYNKELIIGIITDDCIKTLEDYFNFNITGYYKNKNTGVVTSKVKTAYHWKENNDEVIPIYEKEYNLNKNSVYSKDLEENITHINYIPIELYIESLKKLPVNFVPEGFKLISTFRSQESNKTNRLLDDYLIKQNITWFTYIKYSENGVPLVVGKSGSKLVNSSGCDVTFDKNSNGGPARQYLIKNNLNWNKTQIAIYICSTEQKALDKEKEIFKKYNLFYS